MKAPAELYACVLVREFPVQALLRLRPSSSGQTCVVMEGDPPMREVCSRNRAAQQLGVEHGMTQVEVDTFPRLEAQRLGRRGSGDKKGVQISNDIVAKKIL